MKHSVRRCLEKRILKKVQKQRMSSFLKTSKRDHQCCYSNFNALSKSEKHFGSIDFRKRKLKLEHNGKLFTSEPERFNQNVNKDLERNCSTSKRTRQDARKYREFVGSRMKKANMFAERYKISEGGANVSGDTAYDEVEEGIAKNCISHAKRQREDLDSEDIHCMSDKGLSHNLHGISLPKDQASIASNSLENRTVVCDMNAETLGAEDDGRDSNSRCSMELSEQYIDNALVDPHMKVEKDGGEIVCYNCLRGGLLLCCHGKGCQRRYHPTCVVPPLNYIPLGSWHCIWCVKKKIELGVHSISEGVESICSAREAVSKNKVMEREYFVKYQGLAHAHNRWIPETQMLLEAPKLLAKFKRKSQVIRWKREWNIPHRLLLKRAIVLSNQYDEHFDGHDDNDSICRCEWLVKWTGLGYDHVTWELDDASFMTSSEGMKLIEDYESRQKRADRLSNPSKANEERKAPFAELSVLPFGDSPGFYNQHLSYVNKIRMYWHKGQSALVVDDQIDQERVMKVILFILSLHCNVKRPFLIISTSSALSVWETAFLHLAPAANLVVYVGNKDVRSSIRALEFYNDGGGILFQILLSSSDIIVEDLHALRCIQWEAIIIDECQRSRILGHFDNIKILAAEMRLLLVSGQIKEDPADYLKLLSFLKPGLHGLNNAQMEIDFSTSISKLKSQLEQYVAFKCNTGSPRFVEYWVPAQLSSFQIEQYCSMLLSKSMLLCSGQKTDSVDALRDLIISTRKCCDHPYLLDQSLHSFITKGLPVEEYLNIGIKASGKLQLLEKILLEARSRGLRVIILFQSTGGSGSIGDILDDVLCQRFGKDCYVRYGRGYIPSMKQAVLDTFNDRESGKFVFLMESRACLPSIKLSSVDTVILFDSDWDPKNDLRSLQRMSISSQFKQLKVFRLYSSFTVEEKVLMLSKEGIALESNVQLINQSTCHTLLKWGASYLFNKLDDLHGNGTSVFPPEISTDQSLLSDVICELSSQLLCGGDDNDCHGWSFISRVQQNDGKYARNILLQGERVMKEFDNGPHAFSWSNLLEGRHPQWKFLSVSSQRIRKTVKHFDHVLKESELENGAIIRKRRKVSKDNIDPKRRKVSKKIVDTKRRKLSKDIVDPNYLKKRLKNKKNQSAVNMASKMNGNMDDLSKVLDSIAMHPLIGEITRAAAINVQSVDQKKLLDMPKNTQFLPKPDISGLCDVLHLSKNVKAVALRILEHIYEHYNVNCLDVFTMQAFEISVCWLAAYLLKHKIDRKESLALAKLYLNFDCKEEEATDVYSKLQKLKKVFSNCLENGPCVKKCNINGAPDSKTPELKDLAVEEKQEGFEGPHISKLVESATNEHDLHKKSRTTVLSLQDQTYTENFNSRPSMDHEICLSQKTSASLPVEADAISMESDAEVDRMNALDSVTAEVSFLDHQNKVPNSRNDLHNVNTVIGSLERQSPVRSTKIMQSDGKVCEDPQNLVNKELAGDNSMNISTHPAQLNSAETDAISYDSTAVTEVRQWNSAVSPVCGESTTLEFAVTTLPFMQPSHANLWSLPQMAMSAIPSFFEDNSASTVMPPDINFYQSGGDHCNIQEAGVILQAPNDAVEPVNSSSVSPVTQQPSTTLPLNENTTHVPHSITNPGYMNSDPFQAYCVTSEMPHTACSDPLLIEMERIEKVNEEAFKIHEKKILQLQSDYEKEIEKLREKYNMLLQDVNTAVALKRKELETDCKIVFVNKVLAEVWFHNLDCSKRAASQCTEQVAIPSSSSSHVSWHQTLHMPAQRLEQYMAGPTIIQPSLPTPVSNGGV